MAKASRIAVKTANAVTKTDERLDRIEAALRVILTLLNKPEESLKLVSGESSRPVPVKPIKSSTKKIG